MEVNLESVSSQWFKGTVVAGAVVLVAAIIANDAPFKLVGLGILLWGVGEFINHPFKPGGSKEESKRPRNGSLYGYALVMAGAALIVIGLYPLVTHAIS